MKTKNILPLLFIGLLLFGASSSGNFVPEDNRVVSLLYVDTTQLNQVRPNTTLTFDIIIKNLTNDTIRNITITQQIPETLNLVSVMGQSWDGSDVNFTDLSVVSTLDSTPLSLRYLNITSSSFMLNIDISMKSGERIGLQFLMQAEDITDNALFEAPDVTYYDHWGDQYQASKPNPAFNIEVRTTSTLTYLSYIPDFDTTDTDYNLIIELTLAVMIIALLGRILYLKKPFEL